MKLIVGLGNPGNDYKNTRHNIGFLVLEALSDNKWKVEKKFNAQLSELLVNNKKYILLKPLTFMNRSGEAVQAVANFYKIFPKDVIIVHDEADLAFGQIKKQSNRGAAGHNGVQSIIDHLGTKEFTRIRIGIGQPKNPNLSLEKYVLSYWSKEEKEQLSGLIDRSKKLILENLAM